VETVVHRPGDGEVLFGGRILIKAASDELCVTESHYDGARPGAGPHIHERHADTFYVLEGELAFLVHDEEHVLSAGGCVCAPPGVVHGFRSRSPARFLNFHTPDGGFAESLRARDRGEPGEFDSYDAEPGSGLPASNALLVNPGERVQLHREELTLSEIRLEPGSRGPDTEGRHIDAFYVLEGDVEFVLGGNEVRLDASCFLAARPPLVQTVSGGASGSRLLHLRAPVEPR
jgi:quercetin dioxygenase-like cupin family protein